MSFETSLKTFVEIDDELKTVTEEAKVLRKNKAALEAAISAHMVQNDIPEHRCMDTSRVRLFTKKSTKSAFNKAGVYECAQAMLGSDKAAALIAMIEDKKYVTESTGLKRTGAPGAK
ncbi:unnamed protein product [Sphacelaria rigidula]